MNHSLVQLVLRLLGLLLIIIQQLLQMLVGLQDMLFCAAAWVA